MMEDLEVQLSGSSKSTAETLSPRILFSSTFPDREQVVKGYAILATNLTLL